MKRVGQHFWNKHLYQDQKCGICCKYIADNDVVCVTYFMREEYHISYRTLYCRSCYEGKYNTDLERNLGGGG